MSDQDGLHKPKTTKVCLTCNGLGLVIDRNAFLWPKLVPCRDCDTYEVLNEYVKAKGRER